MKVKTLEELVNEGALEGKRVFIREIGRASCRERV